VGPRTSLNECGIFVPTRIRFPDRPGVASRYTDYTIPAHVCVCVCGVWCVCVCLVCVCVFGVCVRVCVCCGMCVVVCVVWCVCVRARARARGRVLKQLCDSQIFDPSFIKYGHVYVKLLF